MDKKHSSPETTDKSKLLKAHFHRRSGVWKWGTCWSPLKSQQTH